MKKYYVLINEDLPLNECPDTIFSKVDAEVNEDSSWFDNVTARQLKSLGGMGYYTIDGNTILIDIDHSFSKEELYPEVAVVNNYLLKKKLKEFVENE